MTRVRVRIPSDCTTLIGPSGDQITVMVDGVGRYADMLESDAQLILFSGLPASVPWREANMTLIETMTPLPRTPIVRVADLQAARPINPFDKAAIAADALASWRGRR